MRCGLDSSDDSDTSSDSDQDSGPELKEAREKKLQKQLERQFPEGDPPFWGGIRRVVCCGIAYEFPWSKEGLDAEDINTSYDPLEVMQLAPRGTTPPPRAPARSRAAPSKFFDESSDESMDSEHEVELSEPQRERAELLARGATAEMIDSFHLRFDYPLGIIGSIDPIHFLRQEVDPEIVEEEAEWKVYFGRTIELGEGDEDGFHFMHDALDSQGEHWKTCRVQLAGGGSLIVTLPVADRVPNLPQLNVDSMEDDQVIVQLPRVLLDAYKSDSDSELSVDERLRSDDEEYSEDPDAEFVSDSEVEPKSSDSEEGSEGYARTVDMSDYEDR